MRFVDRGKRFGGVLHSNARSNAKANVDLFIARRPGIQ